MNRVKLVILMLSLNFSISVCVSSINNSVSNFGLWTSGTGELQKFLFNYFKVAWDLSWKQNDWTIFTLLGFLKFAITIIFSFDGQTSLWRTSSTFDGIIK